MPEKVSNRGKEAAFVPMLGVVPETKAVGDAATMKAELESARCYAQRTIGFAPDVPALNLRTRSSIEAMDRELSRHPAFYHGGEITIRIGDVPAEALPGGILKVAQIGDAEAEGINRMLRLGGTNVDSGILAHEYLHHLHAMYTAGGVPVGAAGGIAMGPAQIVQYSTSASDAAVSFFVQSAKEAAALFFQGAYLSRSVQDLDSRRAQIVTSMMAVMSTNELMGVVIATSRAFRRKNHNLRIEDVLAESDKAEAGTKTHPVGAMIALAVFAHNGYDIERTQRDLIDWQRTTEIIENDHKAARAAADIAFKFYYGYKWMRTDPPKPDQAALDGTKVALRK